jgi:hypothetical protein
MHKPTQELDIVLNFIVSDELAAFIADTIMEKTKIDNIKTMLEILGKLEEDRYIKKENLVDKMVADTFGTTVWYYSSTFNGRLFSENGGYIAQNKKQKILARNEYIRTLLLTYGTALAGLYGVFEILKWLLHHEGWHLFF